MNKGYITIIGYLLFLAGFLSILLMIVGLQLTMFRWLNYFGTGTAFIIKLVMLFSGLIIMYFSKMPPEED